MRVAVFAAAGCLSIVGISAAFESVAASSEGTDNQTSLDEVIVTAQRRSQPLEDVPISVAAIAGKDLEREGVRTLQDLQTVVPSLVVSNSGVFTQLSIRGITSTALGPGIENNIAVYVDGFYEPDSSSLGSDFANVSDIQVLKGPQGTLYGRNATGGALLINTYEPSDQHPIIEAAVGYGNEDDRRVRTYIGVPLTEGLSFGVGAYYRANQGYIRNIDGSWGSPFREGEIRLKLKWEPSSNLSFVLGENYFYKSDPIGSAWTVTNYSPIGLPVGPLYTNKLDYISQSPNPLFTDRLDETTLRAIWKTDYGTFTNHASYTDEFPYFNDDYDGTILQLQQIPARFSRYTFLEQIDYDVKPIPSLEIQAGGFYFHDDSKDNVIVDLLLPPLIPTFGTYEHNVTKMITTAYAGYLDATWEAIPNLFVNAGARYSEDKRTVSAYYEYLVPPLPSLTPGYPTLAPSTTARFPKTTPSATIRYELAPQTNVYVSYKQGFKSGTFNTVATSTGTLTAPVQPEKVDAYEVGFKTAQARYHFETAAYYYDYKDLQVNALGSDPITKQVLVTLTNAATAKIYGAELSLAAEVTSDFNVRAGVAYTHARYQDFPNGSSNIPVTSGGVTSIQAVTQDFSGLRIARAPDWTATIGTDYTIPLGEGKLVPSANAYYTSQYAPLTEAYDGAYTNAAGVRVPNPGGTGNPYYYDSSYVIFNTALNWLQGHYIVGFWCNNVGDKRFAIYNQASTFGQAEALSTPRTYGVRFSYTY